MGKKVQAGTGEEPPGDDVKAMGLRIRSLRKALRLTQEDIAQACETSRAAVSQWELGDAMPTNANLERAARRMRVSFEWLRTGAGAMPPVLLQPVMPRQPRVPRFAGKVLIGPWSTHVDEPPFEGAIAEMAIGAGAGGPYAPAASAAVKAWWCVPPESAARPAKGAGLRIFEVLSDNMEPAIARGAYVLIDTTQTTPQHGCLFALSNNISIILKRVVIDPSQRDKIGLQDGNRGAAAFVPVNRVSLIGRCIGSYARL